MLTPGTRIAHYDVLAAIGAGGMGEVYRARDTLLGREVALKVLPELFAADADRRARFQREAKTLAALNHPNIAAIHGLAEAPNVSALVLELVDGETLAERIDRGPIPLDETLAIAAQIAAALESAHERGIVHRDLKPANVKLTHDGCGQGARLRACQARRSRRHRDGRPFGSTGESVSSARDGDRRADRHRCVHEP